MTRYSHSWVCRGCGAFGSPQQRYCRQCGLAKPAQYIAEPSTEAEPPAPRFRALPKPVIAVIAVMFVGLGVLAALIVRDVRNDDPPKTPTPTVTSQGAERTRPITSTDWPNGGAIRASIQREIGTTELS